MSLTKRGQGEVLREQDDLTKEASQDWTEEDRHALDEENADADAGTDVEG